MILHKIKEFVKENMADIILAAGVVLISLLSFSMGFIAAKQQEREPLRMENYQSPSTGLQTSTNSQDSND